MKKIMILFVLGMFAFPAFAEDEMDAAMPQIEQAIEAEEAFESALADAQDADVTAEQVEAMIEAVPEPDAT